MLEKFNSFLCSLYNLIVFPVSKFNDEIQVLYISAFSGVIFLWIYGKVSNQKGLKETKRKVMAYVLEVALYRHSIIVCLKAQLNLLKQGVRYVSFALIPLLILMVPCLLIMAQLNFHYQNRGIKNGEEVVVEVSFKDDVKDIMDYSLTSAIGKVSPALRIEDEGKIFWKIKNDNTNNANELFVKLKANNNFLNIPIAIGEKSDPLFVTYSKNIFESLMFPTKFSFTKNFPEIQSIKVSYPEKQQFYFGLALNWIWTFLIVSIFSGFIASKILKVEI